MDGFFASSPPRPLVDHTEESVDRFAQAIANRFSNTDKPLLTARLTPSSSRNDPTPVAPRTPAPKHPPGAPDAHDADSHSTSRPPLPFKLSLPATPLARMTLSSPPTPNKAAVPPAAAAAASSSSSGNQFTAITASSLPDLLRTPRILILDIRPHSAYSASRLPHAISLSVPSTLLKRPAFTLQKLSTMLSSSTARNRFQNWKSASRILVYDADSAALGDASNLFGLLRKFRAEGYTGDVGWLKGGIQALWRDHRHLLDQCSVSDDEDEAESPRFLRARNLPQAAFQQASTTTSTRPINSSASPIHSETPLQIQTQSAASGVVAPSRPDSRAPSQAPSASPSANRFTAANPFYDNIRQNLELSHGITERIPLKLSPGTASRTHELPIPWLRQIATAAGRQDSTEALAMQFYRIELDEQRRLQNVMAHHTKQSHGSHDKVHEEKNKLAVQQHSIDENTGFPYSILAGVEKGTKNRYRNIWPFEHSRVRLKDVDGDDDDYINASFVQPLGTRRQYIATQGPLPSTFADFWAIVWEQNVCVIVMLTREFEGASVKCGKYWAEGKHGPFRLKRIAISGAPEEDDDNNPGSASAAGGFFDAGGGRATGAEELLQQHNHTIHRVFELSHAGHPLVKPRIIHHLQYLGWPDMDVPVSPKGLLRLMFEVDELVDAANEGARGSFISPALAHCSAGVGRTGAFIMIDAIMDGVRREIRRKIQARKAALARRSELLEQQKQNREQQRMSDGSSENGVNYAMDVDTTSSREVSIGPPVPPSSDSFQSIASSASLPTPIAGASNINARMGNVSSTPMRFGGSLDNSEGTLATATLPMGGTKGPDIHVPLVPSTASPSSPAQLRTPRPSKPAELTPSIGPSPIVSPFSQALPPSSVLMNSPLISSPTTNAGADNGVKGSIYSKQRQSLFARRVFNSDFSVADADSMFTSSSLNPLFAMDVEPSFAEVRQSNVASSSSSGEGNASGNDRGNASSGSGSGSGGSSSSGRLVRPVQQALARLSSGEDISGPIPSSRLGPTNGSTGHARFSDSDSAAAFAVQTQMRIRTGSRSGSGSGSGESGNDASGSGSSVVSAVGSGSGSGSSGHRLGSSSGSGRGRGRGGSVTGSTGSGGYSSGSSIGIRRFEAMTTNEPSREPVEVVMQSPSKTRPMVSQHQQTDLVAPRPVHLLPAHDLMSMPGTDTATPSPSLSKLTKANVAASALLHHHHTSTSKVEKHQQQQSRLHTHLHHKSSPSTDTSSPFPSSTDTSSSDFKSRADASTSTTAATSVTTLSTTDASPSPPPKKSGHESAAIDNCGREDAGTTNMDAFLDYKAPRELHGDASPPLLSSMDDPIRAILADMREQRMSLCQSLRQYVFVHCAIIEGALWILDEERERAGLSEGEVGDLGLLGWDGRTSGEGTNSGTGSSLSTDEEVENGNEGESGIGMNAIANMAAAISASADALTASQQQKTAGKRGASPTELTKEDKKGELALAKRPSVKRGKSACSNESGSCSADSTGSS